MSSSFLIWFCSVQVLFPCFLPLKRTMYHTSWSSCVRGGKPYVFHGREKICCMMIIVSVMGTGKKKEIQVRWSRKALWNQGKDNGEGEYSFYRNDLNFILFNHCTERSQKRTAEDISGMSPVAILYGIKWMFCNKRREIYYAEIWMHFPETHEIYSAVIIHKTENWTGCKYHMLNRIRTFK